VGVFLSKYNRKRNDWEDNPSSCGWSY